MEETMFLPTPKWTMASGPEKTYRLSSSPSVFLTASKAFFTQPYRSGKVSWPESYRKKSLSQL